MEFILRVLAGLRGRIAHRSVDKTIGNFQRAAERLNTSAGHMTAELSSNIQVQLDIEKRNNQLRAQRYRANSVKKKLLEFVE